MRGEEREEIIIGEISVFFNMAKDYCSGTSPLEKEKPFSAETLQKQFLCKCYDCTNAEDFN